MIFHVASQQSHFSLQERSIEFDCFISWHAAFFAATLGLTKYWYFIFHLCGEYLYWNFYYSFDINVSLRGRKSFAIWSPQLAKSCGWTFPPIVISPLLATGPKASVMVLALSIGQSERKAWKRRKTIGGTRDDAETGDEEQEEEEAVKGVSGLGSWWSW
jgi:hypothetical protein